MISAALPSDSVSAELTLSPRLAKKNANTASRTPKPLIETRGHLHGQADRYDDGGGEERERHRQAAGRAHVEEDEQEPEPR